VGHHGGDAATRGGVTGGGGGAVLPIIANNNNSSSNNNRFNGAARGGGGGGGGASGAPEDAHRKLTEAELNEAETFLSSDDVGGFRAALARLRADPAALAGPHRASFVHFAAQESAVGCLAMLLSR
jgi:hypothetical protein